MSPTMIVASDPSVANQAISHFVRKRQRATSSYEWGGMCGTVGRVVRCRASL